MTINATTRAGEPARAGAATRPARPGGHAEPSRDRLLRGVVATVFVVGVAVRLVPMLDGRLRQSVIGYDDGVHMASALALLAGRLPYRDFLFLQPPGISVLLLPFAALARAVGDNEAFAAARVAVTVLGGANAAGVAWLVRRFGPLAALAAGGFAAVWPTTVAAEHTVLLEPVLNAGLLVALLFLTHRPELSRRAAVLAGAALGVALTVKLWAGVDLVVLAGWVGLRHGRRALLRLAAGSGLALLAVLGVFVAAAPGPMLREVVLDQLGRPPDGAALGLDRLAQAAGFNLLQGIGPEQPHPVPAALVAGLLAGVLLALLVASWRCPAAWPFAALLVAQAAFLAATPSYYAHYGDFLTPALAVVVGIAVSRAAGTVGRAAGTVGRTAHALGRRAPAVGSGQPRRAWAAVPAVLVLGLLGWGVRSGLAVQISAPKPLLGAEVDAVRNSCTVSTSPVRLVIDGALTHQAVHGCPLLVDPTGITFDADRGHVPPGLLGANLKFAPGWQHQIRAALEHAQVAVLDRDWLDDVSRGWFDSHFRPVAGASSVYERRAAAAG